MRVRTQLWELAWVVLCRWTPKPLNAWRLMVLRLFGAKLYGKPFVHQRARVTHPWRLMMHDRSCLGDGAVAYTLGEIEIMSDATVAQEVYICTGTHDFNDPARPLVTAKITIGPSAFVGARAFLLPGVYVGDRAIVGACSVVTRDVEQNTIVAGNPAIPLMKKAHD
jgi:putative colanic acid biosynthesis acetyltransferase WcaF